MKNNRVNLPETSKEKQDIVISSHSDGFFKENMYANYGAYSHSVCLFVAMCRFISACISGFLFFKEVASLPFSRVFFFRFFFVFGTAWGRVTSGDLGLSIKKLVDDFQAVSKMNKQIDSIEAGWSVVVDAPTRVLA